MKLLAITTVDKTDSITGVWRTLNNKELYDLCFSHKYYGGDQIKKNEMGESCGTCGGEVHTGFRLGDLRQRDHLEDLDLGEDNIKTDIQKVGWRGMDCIDLP